MERVKFKTVVVIGAGAFGTSIASVLAHNFQKVILLVRGTELYQKLEAGENSIYLPGKKLKSHIVPALNWDQVEEIKEGSVDLVVCGLPTGAIKGFLAENDGVLRKYLAKGIPLVSLSKGIDPESGELPDDMFFAQLRKYSELFTFLSGPSFAGEIVDQQITLVSLAGRSRKVLMAVTEMLQTDFFKVFQTYDVKGVLLGGALKNVLAIAGGISEGLGYNHNTRAALITMGIQDMLRFGVVFNARPETFYGLSGMGDLILTTTGDLSRNKSFGVEIAKGRSPQEIIGSQVAVVEGYKTTLAVHNLAKKFEIRSKIFEGVYRVLYKGEDPEKSHHGLNGLFLKIYVVVTL